MQPFSDELILLTGAEGNMGPHVSDYLIDRGATVVGTYIDEEEKAWALDRASQPSEITYYEVDLTDYDAVADLADTIEDEHGAIDGVFNLVGGFRPSTLTGTTTDQFRGGFELHAVTVFNTMKAFSSHLEGAGGNVVNFTSQRVAMAESGTFTYNVGKSAVKTMTRTAAKELDDVYVNAIAPYYIATPEKREAGEGMERSHWHFAEDILELIVFFLSTDVVNGEVVSPANREPGSTPS